MLSAVLLVLGLWIRSRVSESPVFKAGLEAAERQEREKPKVPLLSVLRRPKVLILTTLAAVSIFGLQVVIPTFAVSYSVEHGTERSAVLLAQSFGSLVGICAVIGFGRLSDRVGRRPVMFAGLISCAVMIFPMFQWWGSNNIWLITLAFVTGVVTQGAIYGPLAAFITEQFGTEARYTGASLGYQIATLLGAGLTPGILASLYATSGQSVTQPGIYLIGLCVVSFFAVLLTKESKDNNLHEIRH
jgi:MFS family permease